MTLTGSWLVAVMVAAVLGAPSDSPSQKTTAPLETKSGTSQPAVPGTEDPSLTYGGRTFDQWRHLVSTDLEAETRAKAYSAFGAFARHGMATEAVATIRQALATEQTPVALQAAYGALVSAGDAGVPVILDEIRHRDRVHRWATVEAMGKGYNPKLSAAVPALIEVLQKDDPKLRELACIALEHIVAATHQDFKKAGTDVPAQGSAEGDAVAGQVASALGAALKDPEPSVRLAAATSLGHLGPSAKAAAPCVVEYTKGAFARTKAGRQAAVERARTGQRPVTRPRVSNYDELMAGVVALGSLGEAARGAEALLTEIKRDEVSRTFPSFVDNALEAIQAGPH